VEKTNMGKQLKCVNLTGETQRVSSAEVYKFDFGNSSVCTLL
jgi:hypothetical protein